MANIVSPPPGAPGDIKSEGYRRLYKNNHQRKNNH